MSEGRGRGEFGFQIPVDYHFDNFVQAHTWLVASWQVTYYIEYRTCRVPVGMMKVTLQGERAEGVGLYIYMYVHYMHTYTIKYCMIR